MKIAILTSQNSWFVPHAFALKSEIQAKFKDKITECAVFFEYEKIANFDIVFILSYLKIISGKFLARNALNLVIHESNLPQGKGWAPLFWQVIEGKNEICFTLFEADEKVDNGEIYLQKWLKLSGFELYDEIRLKQAELKKAMCVEFLTLYPCIKARKQEGLESFYPKRSPKDSELNINESLKSQFNLLRSCSNDDFPAFFINDGKKYIIKIYDDLKV